MGISVDREKIVLRKHVSRIVIPSEAEGSFSLAVKGSVLDSEKWETPYRRKGGDGASPKRLSEGVVGKGDEKDFSHPLEMTMQGSRYRLNLNPVP